ncbi:MAG: 50S ribosomal protein L30 [Deltaproteobacteria bacterium]|nr:50S ribosomal protein L30 [Deltaproteobacteria bacterium]
MASNGQIKITLNKRPATERLKVILLGLGLKKTNSTKVLQATPAIKGMVAKVSHLVTVEDVR